MISSFECSKCGSYQSDVEDLVEHLIEWHNMDIESSSFYRAIAESIDDLEDAIKKYLRNKREEKESRRRSDDDDDDISFPSLPKPFGGFSGGSFSGGGAKNSW